MKRTGSKELEKLILSFEAVSGHPVVWKSARGTPIEGIAVRRSWHTNPFCTQVKSNSRRIHLCRATCVDAMVKKATSHQKPFRHICHAGVLQIIIPIYHDSRLSGILYWGPFRNEDASCTYTDCLPPYTALADEKTIGPKIKPGMHLLSALSSYIGGISEGVRLSKFGEVHKDHRIVLLMKFIADNLDSDLSIDNCATHLFLSRSRLQHLFAAECGMPLSRYIMDCRMERARHLLQHTKTRLTEVAYEAGFQNYSTFSANFKAANNCGPNEFRKKMQIQIRP